MYICICKKVTDGQIRTAVAERGVCNMRGLRQELGACEQCGKCAVDARQVMLDCLDSLAINEADSLAAA